MAAGVYSGNDNRSISTAITILELQPAAGQMIEVIRAWCTQGSTTTSAQQRIQILRKSSVATLTNAITAAKQWPGAAASGATCKSVATVEGTTSDTLYDDNFNVLQGWIWVASTENERIPVNGGTGLALKFPVAPGSATTFSFGFTWIEKN